MSEGERIMVQAHGSKAMSGIPPETVTAWNAAHPKIALAPGRAEELVIELDQFGFDCGIKEYGIGGVFVGVPCVLGSDGVEKVLEVELDAEEQAAFNTSVSHVKELVAAVKM